MAYTKFLKNYFPKEKKDSALCSLLELLPEQYKDKNFYEKLYDCYKDGEHAVFVYQNCIPKEYRTYSMTLDIINNRDTEHELKWSEIPTELITYDLI